MAAIQSNHDLSLAVSGKLSSILPKPFLIDGDDITDKDSFFNEFAKKLNFPAYFGKNWDAFYDCMTDLSWLKKHDSYLIIYENPFNFQLQNNEDWKLANQILFEAVDYWKQQKQRMVIVFL